VAPVAAVVVVVATVGGRACAGTDDAPTVIGTQTTRAAAAIPIRVLAMGTPLVVLSSLSTTGTATLRDSRGE